MKNYLIIFFLFVITSTSIYSQTNEKARGFFLAFGVGPRIPVGNFSGLSNLGYGFDADVSYTDNEIIPFFVFARIGFEQYPGSQSLYESSDYTNYSVRAVPLKFGIRNYFPPFLEGLPLLLPVAEFSISYCFFQKLNQFKLNSGKSNFTDDSSKLGFNAGVGVSMFLLEIIATYNYYQTNQSIGVDLKVRLPLLISY